jgi:hypothetical protein
VAQVFDPKHGADRAAAVMERGMEKYLAGDLLGAICEWEHALTLDAALARAREYIEYVRENFDALTREFDAAKEAQRLADEAGISDMVGEEPPPIQPDDEPEESFANLLTGEPAALDDALSAVTAGLERAGQEPHPHPHDDEVPLDEIDIEEMEPPREPTQPGRLPEPPRQSSPPMLEIELPPLESHHYDDDGRHSGPAFAVRDYDTADTTGSGAGTAPGFDAEGPTQDFYATPLDVGYEEMTIEAGVDEEAQTDGGDPDQTSDFRPGRDLAKKLKEDDVRDRVGELLRLVKDAADRGDFRTACETAELASAADPDGIVAPVLLHRQRDLIYRVYEGHLGDLKSVPLVAIPLHEISAQSLDHRTGFLLSRIDGMLTFEDILDVAGMPRIEAYQILSALLRKGVIEVR